MNLTVEKTGGESVHGMIESCQKTTRVFFQTMENDDIQDSSGSDKCDEFDNGSDEYGSMEGSMAPNDDNSINPDYSGEDMQDLNVASPPPIAV